MQADGTFDMLPKKEVIKHLGEIEKLEEAYAFVRQLSENGQTLLFVGTKKQAQEAIKDEATRCGQYFVNARWLGGMMTNFKTCLLYTSATCPSSCPPRPASKHYRRVSYWKE